MQQGMMMEHVLLELLHRLEAIGKAHDELFDSEVRESMDKAAVTERLDSFHKRLAAFQNHEVRTAQQNDFNDFFGWANPDDFDEAGHAIQK